MENITILVTGVGGGGVGEQSIKALKLAKNKYEIIGTDITTLCKNKDECDAFYLVPISTDSNYIPALIEIAKKHNVKAIIPGSEAELKIIGKNRDKFLELGIRPFINPQSVLDICMDKSKTTNFLMENGFKYPKTFKIEKSEDLDIIDFFPLVLKPSIGGGGSANTMIAQNKEELLLFGKYMLNIYSEFIIQEYVGTPEQEFTVGVLYDLGGNFINSIVIQRNILTVLSNRIKIKNKTENSSLGPILAISSGISQGEVVKNELVANCCEKISKLLGATGAINVQCRVHNNEVYIFEINPRFSGTTSMRALVGYNEPDVLIRKEILNEEIEPKFKYDYGIIVRGLSEKLIK